MMLFISTYPNSENEKEGMVQRIKAIDDAYITVERTYLEISLRRNIAKKICKQGLVSIFYLNLFLHLLTIIQLLIAAKVIYVHSVYNSIKILPAYFLKNTKIITDMHGAVPEELAFCGNKILSVLFEVVERVVIHRSWKIISVTTAMSTHFASKHRRVTSEDFVIPIMNLKNIQSDYPSKILNINRIPLVIYAGGINKWQNVSLMLDAVKQNTSARYRFLTGSPEVIKNMAVAVGLDSLDIQSVSAEIVYDHYKEADYGFLLRDDHLLNRVACPTKAIEYMATGVIPIVLCVEIGDLKAMGYRYVTLNDFLSGVLPNQDGLEEMRNINKIIVKKLAERMTTELDTLGSLTDR